MKDTFIAAIHAKKKLRLTFYSKADGDNLVRTTAPLDFGPSRRTKDQSDRFHFWDYDSDTARHVLSLLPEQVVSVEVLSDTFDPSEFVTWSTSTSTWFVARDWGIHS